MAGERRKRTHRNRRPSRRVKRILKRARLEARVLLSDTRAESAHERLLTLTATYAEAEHIRFDARQAALRTMEDAQAAASRILTQVHQLLETEIRAAEAEAELAAERIKMAANAAAEQLRAEALAAREQAVRDLEVERVRVRDQARFAAVQLREQAEALLRGTESERRATLDAVHAGAHHVSSDQAAATRADPAIETVLRAEHHPEPADAATVDTESGHVDPADVGAVAPAEAEALDVVGAVHWRGDRAAPPDLSPPEPISDLVEPEPAATGDDFWERAVRRNDVCDEPGRHKRRRWWGPVPAILAGVAIVGVGVAGIAIAKSRGSESLVDGRPAGTTADARTTTPPTTTPAVPPTITTAESPHEEPEPASTATPTPTPTPTHSATPAAATSTGEAPAAAPEPEPALSSSPALPPEPGPAGLAGAILSAMNADRAANGLGPLGWHSGLAGYAQNWANWMAQNMSLAHQDLSPMKSFGLNAVGENVLVGPNGMSAATIESTWMNSSEHRANILNGAFTVAGVGAAISADGQLWIAVDFGG